MDETKEEANNTKENTNTIITKTNSGANVVEFDAIIIGGGAAGMTAGIYLNRAGRKVVIIESNILGGITGTLEKLENYPGLPVGGTGFDLAINMSAQVEHLGIDVVYGAPSVVDLKNMIVEVDGTKYIAKKGIILAMGAGNKKVGLPKEDALIGNGLSYCATCDGAFFRGKDTVIIGNTLHTLDDALYLDGVPCNSVTMVVPGDRIFAAPAKLEELKNTKIRVIYNAVVQGITTNEKNKVSGVEVHGKDGTHTTLKAEALFVALGYTPNTASVYGQVETDEKGYVKIDTATMQTSVPNVYAIGDIRSGSVKQIVGSCYDGMIASMSIIRNKK